MNEKLIIRIGDSTTGGRKPAHRQGESSLAAGPKEVVVYHWGRIFLALGLLVLLSGFGLWRLFGVRPQEVPSAATVAPLEAPKPVAQTPEPPAKLQNAGNPATAAAVQGSAGEGKDTELHITPTKPADGPSQTTSTQVADSASGAGSTSALTSAPLKPGVMADHEALNQTASSTPSSVSPVPATALAEIRILSDHVARAQLTSQLKDKLPTDRLAAAIDLRGRSLIRVYFYTELKGLKGHRVYHRWYHDGKQVASVAIRPYLDDMNASSSKYITPRMTGRWRVMVVDDQGRSLAETAFKVR